MREGIYQLVSAFLCKIGGFMGLFKIKARDKPKVEDRTMGSDYTFYMCETSAGKNVNERSTMQVLLTWINLNNFIFKNYS